MEETGLSLEGKLHLLWVVELKRRSTQVVQSPEGCEFKMLDTIIYSVGVWFCFALIVTSCALSFWSKKKVFKAVYYLFI